ncbi:MAG TPA: glycolate oxidase subunit GlcF [Phenylobacterium sp.]|jgi:glycolate oxidase iron-sulfur subunit|uniref:glycolate oxidase subunit GlcF n=1 Tax=Phenylobacterium sp. TaxID=1871053 RepID=UPI002D74A988|nr:glycolate oxidase subunit GlcF [Phenylobacterium sp.]HZZ66781.1 glycolate oxidase subunit GlcF [Phenylobacterium sp.]
MQTAFTPAQLADPETAASNAQIRKCVHCGFCTATCPTYVLLGDERDSPRGRIELIKAMLEAGGAPAASTVTHVDRCLSCLACKTTCPSGVDYAQLIDHGRAHIEAHYRRPLGERLLRWAIPQVMTRPGRLRFALALGRLARPLEPVFGALKLSPLAALLRLVPEPVAASASSASTPAEGASRGRVALLQGCVEPAMAPSIRAAAIRLIARAGYEVVLVEGEGCCGALSEHLGRADEARDLAAANVAAWTRAGPFDAIVTTAAGCGTTLKAYGQRLAGDGAAAEAAGRTRDILEFIGEVGLPPVTRPGKLSVAYHAPCSLQHGQGIKAGPAELLAQAGFEVRPIAEGHLCCGSAGVYNILQPELAGRLRARKAANIARTQAQVVAAGNVGCIAQIAPAVIMPVMHPVELLDWATGGPKPADL